jgi:hypothetical protein
MLSVNIPPERLPLVQHPLALPGVVQRIQQRTSHPGSVIEHRQLVGVLPPSPTVAGWSAPACRAGCSRNPDERRVIARPPHPIHRFFASRKRRRHLASCAAAPDLPCISTMLSPNLGSASWCVGERRERRRERPVGVPSPARGRGVGVVGRVAVIVAVSVAVIVAIATPSPVATSPSARRPQVQVTRSRQRVGWPRMATPPRACQRRRIGARDVAPRSPA